MTTGYEGLCHGRTGIDGDHGSAIQFLQQRAVGPAGDRFSIMRFAGWCWVAERWNIPVADSRAVRVSRGPVRPRSCFPIRVTIGNVGSQSSFRAGANELPRQDPPGDARPDGGSPSSCSRHSPARSSATSGRSSRRKAAQAIVFPGTGTGGWESALVNTLSPGDKVLSFPLRAVQPSLDRHDAAAGPRRDRRGRGVG